MPFTEDGLDHESVANDDGSSCMRVSEALTPIIHWSWIKSIDQHLRRGMEIIKRKNVLVMRHSLEPACTETQTCPLGNSWSDCTSFHESYDEIEMSGYSQKRETEIHNNQCTVFYNFMVLLFRITSFFLLIMKLFDHIKLYWPYILSYILCAVLCNFIIVFITCF